MKNERPNKGKSGGLIHHPESFKVQLALEYLDNDYSISQIGKKYGLSKDTVSYFVSWYRKQNESIMSADTKKTENSSSDSTDLKALEKKLALAEMKIAALEKVIAIANEAYGTDLKKKAFTK